MRCKCVPVVVGWAVGAAALVVITFGGSRLHGRATRIDTAEEEQRLGRRVTNIEQHGALRAESAVAEEAPGGGRVPFVFVAGVEGTGHHWYGSFFQQCGTKRCRPSVLGLLAFHRCAARFNSRMETDAGTLAVALEAASVEVELASADEEFALFALNTARQTESPNFLSNLLSSNPADLAWKKKTGGEQSYPNFGGKSKAIQMPSMVLIEESLPPEAELRVLLSSRSADAIIRSVCDKRKFGKDSGGCAIEVSILVLGAAAMSAQIDALSDLASCEVFEYEHLQAGDPAALAKLGVYLGLDDAAEIVKRVNGRSPAASLAPEYTTTERAALIVDLETAYRTLKQACHRHR